MTCFNGRLLLFCHDQRDALNDRVFEFDPAAKTGEQPRQVLGYTLSNDLDGDFDIFISPPPEAYRAAFILHFVPANRD